MIGYYLCSLLPGAVITAAIEDHFFWRKPESKQKVLLRITILLLWPLATIIFGSIRLYQYWANLPDQ